jgi:hypothetical protein
MRDNHHVSKRMHLEDRARDAVDPRVPTAFSLHPLPLTRICGAHSDGPSTHAQPACVPCKGVCAVSCRLSACVPRRDRRRARGGVQPRILARLPPAHRVAGACERGKRGAYNWISCFAGDANLVQLGDTSLPEEQPETVDDELLQKLHHVLLEVRRTSVSTKRL